MIDEKKAMVRIHPIDSWTGKKNSWMTVLPSRYISLLTRLTTVTAEIFPVGGVFCRLILLTSKSSTNRVLRWLFWRLRSWRSAGSFELFTS